MHCNIPALIHDLGSNYREFYVTKPKNLRLELGPKHTLSPCNYAGDLPRDIDRGNSPEANYFYDTASYLLDAGTPNFEASWNLNIQVAEDVGDHALAAQMRVTRKALASTDFLKQLQDEADRKAVAKGGKPKPIKPSSIWVLLSYKGTLLAQNEALRTWYQNNFERIHSVRGTTPGVCYITGECGQVLRLHPKVSGIAGTGGKAQLFSYNELAYEYTGRVQGENFPISFKAAEDIRCGFQFLLRREDGVYQSSIQFKSHTVALFVPKKEQPPIIKLAVQLLAPFYKAEPTIWEEVEKVSTSGAIIQVVSFLVTKGRVSPTKHGEISDTALKENLLKFKARMAQDYGSPSLGTALYSLSQVKALPDRSALRVDITWSIMLGTPFTPKFQSIILDAFSKDPESKSIQAWVNYLYYDRTPAMPATPCACDTSDRKDYTDPLSTLPDNHPRMGSDEKNLNPYYTLGRLIALFCQIKGEYHHWKIEHDPSSQLKTAHQNSSFVFSDMVTKVALYEHRMKATNQFRNIFFYAMWDYLSARIQSSANSKVWPDATPADKQIQVASGYSSQKQDNKIHRSFNKDKAESKKKAQLASKEATTNPA
jgi:hypothetical protein